MMLTKYTKNAIHVTVVWKKRMPFFLSLKKNEWDWFRSPGQFRITWQHRDAEIWLDKNANSTKSETLWKLKFLYCGKFDTVSFFMRYNWIAFRNTFKERKIKNSQECFNSPYGSGFFPTYAERIPGESTHLLSQAAKDNKVYLVGGENLLANDNLAQFTTW